MSPPNMTLKEEAGVRQSGRITSGAASAVVASSVSMREHIQQDAITPRRVKVRSLVEQRLGRSQFQSSEPLSDLTVDRCQELAGLDPFASGTPQAAQARRRA